MLGFSNMPAVKLVMGPKARRAFHKAPALLAAGFGPENLRAVTRLISVSGTLSGCPGSLSHRGQEYLPEQQCLQSSVEVQVSSVLGCQARNGLMFGQSSPKIFSIQVKLK